VDKRIFETIESLFAENVVQFLQACQERPDIDASVIGDIHIGDSHAKGVGALGDPALRDYSQVLTEEVTNFAGIAVQTPPLFPGYLIVSGPVCESQHLTQIGVNRTL
jgi:hypothetical protein